MNEIQMLLDLKQHVEHSLELLEIDLILADPTTHTKEDHDFLIKKVRMFRNALTDIDERLSELGY